MRTSAVAIASTLSPIKSHHYNQASSLLRTKLATAIPRDELKRLHVRRPWRHFLVTFRQIALLALSSYVLVRFAHPLVWIPFAFVQGFTIFNFTVLLHEVVHETVGNRYRPRLTRLLGVLCSFPSAISHRQLTLWHLSQHANLASRPDDP